MSIRDADVQRVREATDLVALIGRRVSLKRVGSRHVGLCPFHTEKTPSFSVDGSKGFYHCFGCKASGDAITFLRETDHLDFADAVEQLAAAANITLVYDAPGAQQANKRRKELLELLERAAVFYHERLMKGPDAGAARAYLRRRGYERDTVIKWRLGYAPPSWNELGSHLGAAPDQLAAAGLGYVDPASDFFRDRVMFPICDVSGRVVSFAGRVLPRPGEAPPKGPKYKNTAGTAVYDKSKVLYGLHLAKQAARQAERIVVCEGHTDVIGCDLAGISEAVATCGTALTAQHAELLSRSAKRIVLAFDADAAGQSATERVHQWERAYGLSVTVAKLPPDSDPGDLATSDPPALRRALEEAQPLHTFRAERILQRGDLDSPAGRDRTADEAAEVFAVYPPEILLDRDLAPVAAGIPMDVAQFRTRVDAARHRLEERQAATATDSYGDDAPPPPEPDDGYFESFDGHAAHSGDPFGDSDYEEPIGGGPGGVVSAGAAGRSRRAAVRAERQPQQKWDDDVRVLAAAMAPQGDALSLLRPELLATRVAKQALEMLKAEPLWREESWRDVQGLNQQEPDEGPDGQDARQMLVKAASDGASLSSAEAVERVAMAHWRFVRATRRSVRSAPNVPHAELDPSNAHNDQLLRWLLDRETELLEADTSVGAAAAIVDWLAASDQTAAAEG